MNEQMKKNEEIEINLYRLLRPVRRHFWSVVAVSGLVALVCMVVILLFAVPQYESSVLFFVGDAMADSHMVILETRETRQEIIADAGITRSVKALGKMIDARIEETPLFLRVSVTSPDPQEAERIAASVGRILPRRVSQIVGGVTASVADRPVTALKPSCPNYILCGFAAFLVGFALVSAVLILRDGKSSLKSCKSNAKMQGED